MNPLSFSLSSRSAPGGLRGWGGVDRQQKGGQLATLHQCGSGLGHHSTGVWIHQFDHLLVLQVRTGILALGGVKYVKYERVNKTIYLYVSENKQEPASPVRLFFSIFFFFFFGCYCLVTHSGSLTSPNPLHVVLSTLLQFQWHLSHHSSSGCLHRWRGGHRGWGHSVMLEC